MEPQFDNRRGIWAAFLRSTYGSLFVVGCGMLLAWMATAATLWQMGSEQWDDLLSVGFAHLLAGRAISIARGTYVGFPKWVIVLIASYADITGMMIVFPLFVFSYENFFEGRFFQTRMKPMLESAQRRADRFSECKIAGVFFFVWLPFWMTGVIVGAVLGYLLGLRTWVSIVAASLGAVAAVVSWVYAYDILFRWLASFHQEIPLVFSIVLLAALLGFHIWRKRKRGT